MTRALAVISMALIAGCGGGWADADMSASTNAARLELDALALSQDGGSGQIRALERAAFCANASMLLRHGQPVPEDGGGILCQP